MAVPPTLPKNAFSGSYASSTRPDDFGGGETFLFFFRIEASQHLAAIVLNCLAVSLLWSQHCFLVDCLAKNLQKVFLLASRPS